MGEETRLINFEILGSGENYNLATAQNTGIRLSYKQNHVKFEFATLDFLNARQIKYSYKLDGFDAKWIENGNNNSATYTNLTGGDYTFKVRAAIKEAVWYEKELAVKLHINA